VNNFYLARYAWPGPILKDEPAPGTNIIVVIPCFNEPNVLRSLQSLSLCDSPDCHVEIIIVVNHSEDASDDIKTVNLTTIENIEQWIDRNKKPHLIYHVIPAFDLPKKAAGVGLARKIGMDEAVRRFEILGNKKGVIACFDADCLCSSNYLVEIQKLYQKYPNAHVGLVHFEHPLEEELQSEIYHGIINYELHLRYFKNALRFTQFPHSYHTIGSCITVTAEVYQKQNGMNKRKAGEDFYFLQKVFPLGNVYCINTATVYPSPRPSDRVPFGTGKAITDYLQNKNPTYLTYNLKSFIDLKKFIQIVPDLFGQLDMESIISRMPLSIKKFLPQIDFENNLGKIRSNCTTTKQFIKAFYQWFNGFSVLKYVHFARDNFYENIEILEATNWLLEQLSLTQSKISDKRKALEILRDFDRSQQ